MFISTRKREFNNFIDKTIIKKKKNEMREF